MNDSIFHKSPAKLNLFLNIKSKRADGFHNIETVFEKISLFDDIKIFLVPSSKFTNRNKTDLEDINIECKGIEIPVKKDEDNIIYKAAKLFMSDISVKKKIKIQIFKRIPPGSGLGGGSSNAATVLKSLNSLFKANFSKDKLMMLGGKIGMDVPFFIENYNFGFGTGRGEKITKIKTKLEFWHLLIYPEINISTAQAYKLFNGMNNGLTKKEVNVKLLIQALKQDNIEKVSEGLYNIFEDIIFKKFEYILKIKNKLLDLNAKGTLLTGSGSAVYGVFLLKKEAIKAKQKLKTNNNFPYTIQGPIRTLNKN